MTHNPHTKQPRQNVIFDAVNQYVRETSVSLETFCQAAVEHYEGNIYPRDIAFSKHEDVNQRIKGNCKRIKRWMELDAHARFPVEMEESVVAALPDKYRLPLLSKLAARYGLIATPMPNVQANHAADFARLLEKVGTTVQAMSPILADGKVCANDLPHVDAAQDELTELLAAAYGWLEQLQDLKKIRAVQNVS